MNKADIYLHPHGELEINALQKNRAQWEPERASGRFAPLSPPNVKNCTTIWLHSIVSGICSGSTPYATLAPSWSILLDPGGRSPPPHPVAALPSPIIQVLTQPWRTQSAESLRLTLCLRKEFE